MEGSGGVFKGFEGRSKGGLSETNLDFKGPKG